MNWIPLYDKIVVEIMNKQQFKSATGLVYDKDFSQSNNTTVMAKVIAVGDGRLLQNGNTLPLKVKVGDTVVFSKMQGESFEDGEHAYTILSESNVLAIIELEDIENNANN